MQFQVPQFLEVEDKIFGPFTLKQFIYLAGGAGISVVLFLFIPWWYVSIVPIALILGFSAALAFYKVNNKPFIYILEAGVKYIFNPKLYIWKKEEPQVKLDAYASPEKSTDINPIDFIPQIRSNKLKDLSWDLTTKKELGPEIEEKVKTGDRGMIQ